MDFTCIASLDWSLNANFITLEAEAWTKGWPDREDKNLNYDEFCDLMSEKKYKVGYSQFIGELYNNELMDYHVFAKNIFAFLFVIN